MTDESDERQAATPSKEEHDTLEVVATVLLGAAAILIAWSAYQSALWGGQQDTALTSSVNTNTAAVDSLQEADTTRALDQTLFIELFTSGACDDDGDEFVCEQIVANMSEPGTEALDEWFENDEFVAFENEAYNEALYASGNELMDDSEVFFTEAEEANENGDKYELASTILTIVLFFAGISIVLRYRRLRIGLLASGTVFLVGAAIYLVTLPLA